MKTIKTLVGMSCLLGGISNAQADSAPRLHDGFHFQLAGGFGYYSVSADIPGGGEQGFSGVTLPMQLLMGGTIGPVVIGGGLVLDYAPSPSVESNGMDVEGLDISQFVVGIGLYADYYLDRAANGLHIQAFAGWGGLETSSSGNVGGSDPTGLVTYIGAGYDIWLTDEWSVGGLARIVYAPLDFNSVSYTTFEPAVLAALTWH